MAVIKDVAKLAGVSVGTVSKYLNKPQSLKDATRQKVAEAIDILQYQPSPLARSMRTGKTNTIAVIAPDITNPFFAEIFSAIRLSSVSRGYTPILYTNEDDLKMLKTYLTEISLRPIDGLILCFVEEAELVENFLADIQTKLPVVLISWDINNARFNCVSIDVFEGILKATNHLIALGHQKIAYIGGAEKNRISREKYSGYCKALRDNGLKLQAEQVFRGDFTLQTGYNAARNITMLPDIPTAIVAENDILAIGGMKYLLQQGIKIPDEMAIIGFDNIALSSMYEPSLSTISLPIPQIGEESLKLLLSGIHKAGARNKLVILQNELIVRNSTDKKAPLRFIG